jgi:hypothetical protein
MTREEALEKLISVRHHCFVRGVAGRSPSKDFRLAFRTLNRLYVELRDNIAPEARPISRRRALARRK